MKDYGSENPTPKVLYLKSFYVSKSKISGSGYRYNFSHCRKSLLRPPTLVGVDRLPTRTGTSLSFRKSSRGTETPQCGSYTVPRHQSGRESPIRLGRTNSYTVESWRIIYEWNVSPIFLPYELSTTVMWSGAVSYSRVRYPYWC